MACIVEDKLKCWFGGIMNTDRQFSHSRTRRKKKTKKKIFETQKFNVVVEMPIVKIEDPMQQNERIERNSIEHCRQIGLTGRCPCIRKSPTADLGELSGQWRSCPDPSHPGQAGKVHDFRLASIQLREQIFFQKNLSFG